VVPGAILYEKDLYAPARDAFNNGALIKASRRGNVICVSFRPRYEPAVILCSALDLLVSGKPELNRSLDITWRFSTSIWGVWIAYQILMEFLRSGERTEDSRASGWLCYGCRARKRSAG
jgi:hypothetical protein